jgi:glycosyltransferase involved in cell wall biosynthesis
LMEPALPDHCDLVIVLPHLGPGGAQKVALMAADHFLQHGLRVALVTLLPDKPIAHVLPEGLPWIDLGPKVAETWSNRALTARAGRFVQGWCRRLLAWLVLGTAWTGLRTIPPGRFAGCVHWLMTSVSGVQASLLRDLLVRGRPVRVLSLLTRTNLLCCQALWASPGHLVVSERNDPRLQTQPFPWPRLQSWLWHRADVITANTAGVLTGLKDCYPKRASEFRLLPNPLVVAPAAVNRCGDSSDRELPCFLAVCRLVPQKGIDLLVRAYAQLPDALRAVWPLVIVGDGPDRSLLEALAASLLPADQVQFLGFQPNPLRFYRPGAVFVLPSRYEGMPNALLEAMGSGLSVIVSDASPGPMEVVRHGESGWVVPSEQVGPLSNAMQRLAEDDALRLRLGSAAAELMTAHSWDALDATWKNALCLEG